MWTRVAIITLFVSCVLCQKDAKIGNKPNKISSCHPPCRVPSETCIKLSNCKAPRCHMCAETHSIRLPGSTPQDLQKQKQLAMMMQMQAMQRMAAKKPAATPAPKSSTSGFLFGMNSGNPMMDLYMTRALMDGGGFGFFGM